MSAVSRLGWESWGASSSSWDEGRWETTGWKNAEHEGKDLVTFERSQGTIEVRVTGLAQLFFQENVGRS